ncbi:hypothetical protein [Microbacterium hominis]|uniref:DUF4430 domain-containing protein n=1 Tax=Microbacterium hominis TaxID=162426 RepID=A0A7D4TE02_9MICO|nr:hypothetical protein [Microbacterium hominis]QKJ18540.1 hypothetical protein HQM25_03495 [Microbacterium hominis]
MTSTRRLFPAAAAIAAALFALTACASGPAATETSAPAASSAPAESVGECSGVLVVIETGDLEVEDSPAGSTCIDTDEAIGASDALTEAGITVEGTEEFGDQVVCRVNGVPAEDLAIPAEDGSDYFETCASMPAAFAYWSLFTRPVAGQWGYATEGLATLELQPGESLALLFTLNGEPAAPTS